MDRTPTASATGLAAGDLRVDLLTTGPTTLARLEGELDAASAAHLVDALEPAVRAGAHVVVLDCGPLTFLDSSGLRALVIVRGLLPRGGTLSLVRTSERLRSLLDVTGLAGSFEVS